MQSPVLLTLLNSFPRPAILLDRDYRIVLANDRYRAVYGFTDQPRRHKCYEVSHNNQVPCDLAGETCPLKDSLRTGQATQVLHVHHTPRGEEYVNVEMWPVHDPDSGEITHFIEQMRPSDAASAHSSADDRLVGSSPAFQRMLNLVERVAPSSTNVMLLGESGTGKELVAQTLHRLSPRSDQPFVPVECTGLPDTLFESELFGYVKGAFTGATNDKPGLIAAAHEGTLFLDEVGDIPLPDQVKLLRLLETKRYRQVGSNDWLQADFRLVCATNKDLNAMVRDGSFREDLFYRLSVFEIELPPLRDRRDDLDALTTTLLQRLGATGTRFSDDARAALREYGFPGNIRELRNIVERAVLLADEGVVHPEHLPPRVRTDAPPETPAMSGIMPLAEAERRYLLEALQQHTGTRRELAEQLGVSERVLYRKLKDLRIQTDW